MNHKQLFPIFEQQVDTHFTTADLKTKAEAASIYMLSDNFFSADVLFKDLETKPSSESWYQLMLALFVFKMDSYDARSLQSAQVKNLSNLIRSRKLWFFYPVLIATDLFLESPLELEFASRYLPTWAYFKQKTYSNELNKNIYKKMLTN